MDLENWFARRSEDQYARPVERVEDLRLELRGAEKEIEISFPLECEGELHALIEEL